MSKRFDQLGAEPNHPFNWQSERSEREVSPHTVEVSDSQPNQAVDSHSHAPTSGAANAPAQSSRRRRSHRRSGGWGWSILCLGTLGVFGSLGTLAFIWLTHLPPLPDCHNISPLSADMERLYCARETAQSGKADDLIAGLEVVQGWSTDHPLYHEAQQLLADWSALLVTIARTKAEQGGLDEAIAIAHHIPTNSPVYGETQKMMASWQQEWKDGEAIYAKAQAALKTQNWSEAAAQVPALGRLSNPYWRRNRASDLTQEVLTERSARETLIQAQKLAKDGDLGNLGQAIALMEQIDPQTYAWAEAKMSRDTWSQTLLAESMALWQQGRLEAAMELAQQIPPTLNLPADAHDLVQFSHAQKLATENDHQFQQVFQQLWGLTEAVAAVRQIQPESLLYPMAQAKSRDWQRQIQDLTQLQFANFTASLGQRTAYEIAIGQAGLIAADRPKRVQAQSLIALWTLQIERIEDQPYLLYARQQADIGTIPALRDAIAIARQISLGRALRLDAQTAIANWSIQIETIEDQPLMTRAQTLAQQGKLQEAIDAARKVQSGRALYDSAQAAIASWKAQIQATLIAEDRRILNKASSLAASEHLTEAIETASQLGPERPLYEEAQAAIDQWQDTRASIWANWESQNQPSDDYASSEEPSSEEQYNAPQ